MKRMFLFYILFGFLFVGTWFASSSSLPSNVNFAKVQSAWLDRQNQERTTLGLMRYTWNTLLDHSAQQRATYLKTLGTTTHRRKSADGYYNYRSIKNRFSEQGVWFTNDSGTMFSESLGRWYMTCKKADCTDALISALKKTFAYFMKEKWKRYQPHYKAIVSKEFTDIWLGITIVGKKYYLVSHYGKNVVATWSKLAKTGK